VEQVVPSGSNAAIIHCEAAPWSALLDKFSERIQTRRAVADALTEKFSEQIRMRRAGPNARNALKQPLDCHGSRLATFDDRGDHRAGKGALAHIC
jgi:hypothetical protein